MATPMRPCPYCGAAVLMNAPACGTCGRPMPPMPAGGPPGGGQPAKTMFGYAAPVIPQAGGRPGAPAPGPAPAAGQPPRPGAPAGYPPGQGGFQPPQQQGFGQPPGAAPGGGFGQPPGQPGFPPGATPGGGFGQPPGQPGFPPPGGAPGGFGQPQGANPYGQPAPGGFPPPGGQPGFPPPGGQPGFPPPGGQPGFGQPQGQPGYGQPQAQPGYGQPQGQPGYPQANNPFAPPQQDLPGPMDDLARRIPTSAPGTIFGFPVSRLRDGNLQRKILFLAGVALVASIIVPFTVSPTIFSWSLPGKFDNLIWPIIAGGAYLLVAAAPPDVRAKVPPAVLHWIPFGVAFAGVFMSKMGFGAMFGGAGAGGGMSLYILGYTTLVFGLLARISQPNDQIARIVIAVGAGLLIPDFFDALKFAFEFKFFPGLIIVHNLIWIVVWLLGILCILFVVPPQKLPPALQSVDAFGPLIAAVLIAWLPVQQLLFFLAGVIHAHKVVGSVLMLAHGLLPIVAYFGVLMMASPAAYEEAKAMFMKNKSGGGAPPQAPPGGGYPPPGGGYPPPGGGYPPPGGGYPPQGGGYPQQGGGGWPQ